MSPGILFVALAVGEKGKTLRIQKIAVDILIMPYYGIRPRIF